MEPGSARFRFSSMCCRCCCCCCCSPTPSTPYMSPTCIPYNRLTLPPLYRPSRHGDSSPWPVSHASTKPSGTSATSLLYVLDIRVPAEDVLVRSAEEDSKVVVSRRRVVAPTVPRLLVGRRESADALTSLLRSVPYMLGTMYLLRRVMHTLH